MDTEKDKRDILVSIIIPVYNSEIYIEKCIRSIMHQTYKSLEIIIIDDGSNDESNIICQRLKLEDERIQIYNQENMGSTHARKKEFKCLMVNI